MDEEMDEVIDRLKLISYFDIAKCVYKEEYKTEEIARQALREGDAVMERRSHTESMHEYIWSKFTIAIATAPNHSRTLSYAYAKRSALLAHIGKYKECIADVDRSVAINKSPLRKAKWLCRKVKCQLILGDHIGSEKTLLRAKYFFNRYELKGGISIEIRDLIARTENILEKKILPPYIPMRRPLSVPRMKKAAHDYKDVAIITDDSSGRYLVAAHDIEPGDVILIDKPYCLSIVNFENAKPYCSHCYAYCLATIPCNNCSWIMFCSEKCKTDACDNYHKFQCLAFKNYSKDVELSEYTMPMALRIAITERMIKGDAGSLRRSLDLLDYQRQFFLRNFFTEEGKLNNDFEAMYCTYCDISSKPYMDMALSAVFSLLLQSKFFGRKYKMEELKNLYLNSNVVAFGALILKLLKVCHQTLKIYPIIDSERSATTLVKETHCISTFCNNIISFSDNPNVNSLMRKDHQIFFYAIQPIKKNERIFVSKISLSDLLEASNINVHMFDHPLETTIYERHKTEITNALSFNRKFQYTEDTLFDITNSIEFVSEKLPESVICKILTQTLDCIYFMFYGITYKMPEECGN